MSWNDHDHRGEYAEDSHDHYDYAREHHRHYGLENDDEKASRRITAMQDEVDGLRGQLGDALERIRTLEGQTPQARQLQLEADLAAADLAESGYDRHGRDCRCPFCYYDPDEDRAYGPGPGSHEVGAGSPLVPPGQIDAEVAADVRRLTGKDPS